MKLKGSVGWKHKIWQHDIKTRITSRKSAELHLRHKSWVTRLIKHSLLNITDDENIHIYIEWGMIMKGMMIMMMAMMVTFCPTLWAIRISLTLVVMANVSNSFVRAAISYKLGPANYRRHHDDYCQSFVSIIMMDIFAAIISIIVFVFNRVNLLWGGSLEVGLRAFSWEIIGDTRSHLICRNLSFYIIIKYYYYINILIHANVLPMGSQRVKKRGRLGKVGVGPEPWNFFQLFQFFNPIFLLARLGSVPNLEKFFIF